MRFNAGVFAMFRRFFSIGDLDVGTAVTMHILAKMVAQCWRPRQPRSESPTQSSNRATTIGQRSPIHALSDPSCGSDKDFRRSASCGHWILHAKRPLPVGYMPAIRDMPAKDRRAWTPAAGDRSKFLNDVRFHLTSTDGPRRTRRLAPRHGRTPTKALPLSPVYQKPIPWAFTWADASGQCFGRMHGAGSNPEHRRCRLANTITPWCSPIAPWP